MQYRSFSRIPGVDISVLGFGCMRLPVLDGDMTHIDEERALPLLRYAIDQGVNYVDTAYPYHGGMSEPFVGRALKNGYREKTLLATKSPVWLVQNEADWERRLDEQLKKLDTDCIDFYLLHALGAERWETVCKFKGLAAMEKAKADGRIKHIGFSFHGSPSAFTNIIDAYDWEFCQIQLNYMDGHYQAGLEGMRYAAQHEVGVISMEPLRGGALAAEPPAPVKQIWAKSPTLRSPAEWALRWVWNHPEVVTALSGMNAEEQLAQNLAAADAAQADSLEPFDLELIEEVRSYFAAKTAVPCTTCGYCQPCPANVSIPDVFSLYNTRSMFNSAKATAWLYDYLLLRNGRSASQCIECGECEPKCPQEIAIPTQLKKAHAVLTNPN